MKMPRTKRQQFALGGLIGALLAIFLVLTLLFVATRYSPPVTRSPYLASHLAFFAESNQEQGHKLYLADLETRQIAPVISVSLGTRPSWSPDGKHMAFTQAPDNWPEGWVVDVEQGKTAQVDLHFPWGWFQTWVSGGRYVVFTAHNQYHNGEALVFDTSAWQVVLESAAKEYCELGGMGHYCQRRMVAASPTAPLILLGDGTLFHLPDLVEPSFAPSDLFFTGDCARAMLSPGFYPAAWSPDGTHLAFVGSGYVDQDCALHLRALYLARGDGTQIQRMTIVPRWETFELSWATDSKSVTLEGKEQKYVLDVASQQVQVLPCEASTQESQPPQRVDPCGDVDRFFAQDSELLPGETVTAACWSPDGALLAVGTPDALNVYDAQLSLLLSLRVDGAVEGISWSPVP